MPMAPDEQAQRVGALVSLLALVACSSDANCLLLGDDPLADVDRVTELARTANIAVSEAEAAFMVGGAIALGQIERAGVRVCLRSGADGNAEYRLVANSGEVVGWRSAVPLPSNAR